MTHHCIIGYDPGSDRAEYSLRIPESKADLPKRFVSFEPDDPDGYDCYKLEYPKLIKMLDLLGHKAEPPQELEYFVEPALQERADRAAKADLKTRAR